MVNLNKISSFLFFLLLVVLGGKQLNAQVITDKTYYDFGDLEKEDIDYVDFKFTNASEDQIKITHYETPYGVTIRISDKIMDPDESILVRIKYTPKRKGEFRVNVPVYVSSNIQPIVLTVEGKAISYDVDESMEVPDFEKIQESKADETFSLDIKVKRKDDGSPVNNAKLDIIWNGVMYRNLSTDENGLINNEFVSDKYYIVVKAENLGSFESELSIHKNVKEFVIELGPKGTISQVTKDSADVYETEIIEVEEDTIEEVIVAIPIVTPIEKEQENPDFSDIEYIPNNIVFLIDVSVSMKQRGKMNLLKASMIELTNLLRSVDKVAIVTYSTKAVVALKSTSARNKREIKEVIQSLEPKGSTSGSRGVKKAYQVLAANEIKNGNNQIFISTDGAFNLEKQDKGLVSIAKKNAKKGYKISVIGIKNEKWTVKNMKLLAQEGNGNYLHITNYNDAKNKLVEEIKTQSKQTK